MVSCLELTKIVSSRGYSQVIQTIRSTDRNQILGYALLLDDEVVDDLEDFYLVPIKDTKYGKAESEDVTKDLVSDYDIEDSTLTKDEGEAETTAKSGRDDELPEEDMASAEPEGANEVPKEFIEDINKKKDSINMGDPKVINNFKNNIDIEPSTNDVLMDVDIVPEDNVSKFNATFEWELIYPSTLDWNRTRPFCQEGAESVEDIWSNLGDVGDDEASSVFMFNADALHGKDSNDPEDEYFSDFVSNLDDDKNSTKIEGGDIDD